MMKDSQGNSYLRIKPNESIIAIVLAQWSEDATDKTKHSKATFESTFELKQITGDMTVVTDANDVDFQY